MLKHAWLYILHTAASLSVLLCPTTNGELQPPLHTYTHTHTHTQLHKQSCTHIKIYTYTCTNIYRDYACDCEFSFHESVIMCYCNYIIMWLAVHVHLCLQQCKYGPSYYISIILSIMGH